MRWICSGLLIAQRPPCFGVTPDASAWCGTVVETSSLVNKAGTEISVRWYPPRPRVGAVDRYLSKFFSAAVSTAAPTYVGQGEPLVITTTGRAQAVRAIAMNPAPVTSVSRTVLRER